MISAGQQSNLNFFALIKEPREYFVGGRKRIQNLAVGGVAAYAYTWYNDKLDETIEKLKQILSKVARDSKWLKWKTFEVYVAEKKT